MRKLCGLFLLLALANTCFSQGKKNKQDGISYETLYKSYQFSRNVHDNSSATASAILLYQGSGEEMWLDTLSMLYLKQEMHEANIQVSSSILKTRPDNSFARINKAYSEYARDSTGNALADITVAYRNTGRADLLFYKSFLECSSGMVGDCLSSIDKLQNNAAYKKLKVNFPFSPKGETIPAEAGVLYMQARILLAQEQKEPALKLLNDALELEPDFKQAQDLKKELLEN